jgi:hypothetical protein
MCSGFHHAGCSNYRPAYDRGYRKTPTRAASLYGRGFPVSLHLVGCKFVESQEVMPHFELPTSITVSHGEVKS